VKAAPQRPPADADSAADFYDAFERSEALPQISPAPGRYADTVVVSLRASIYDSAATLRYTIDGSQPSALSTAYADPFSVSRDAVVRARAFHGGQPSSRVVSAAFKVQDVTPPSITSVLAFPGSTKLYAVFSEAVDARTASDPASYNVTGLTVESAAPGADGRSVALAVSPAPQGGIDYALTAGGVKDTSPNANAAGASKGASFRAASPAATVSPDSGDRVNVMGNVKTVDSPHGRAYSFNAGSDAVELGNRPELNPTKAVTITAWIRPADWSSNRRILQKGNNDDQYRLTASFGKLLWEISGIGEATAPLPSVNAWHHVAAAYDGKAMTLYIDGEIAGEAAVSGPIPGGPDNLFVGTKYEGAAPSDRFIGEITDVRVYDQALLPEHILALAR
jgi:hypothetical protein